MDNDVNQNRIRKAGKNAAIGIVHQFVTVLFPFILRTCLIQVLGGEYLGLNSLFTSILSVLNLADLGLGSAIAYNMYEPLAKGDTDTVCALLKLYRNVYRIIGCIVLAVGLCLVPFLPKLIHGTYPQELNLTVLYLIYLFGTVSGYFFFAHRVSLMDALQQNYVWAISDTVFLILLSMVRLALLFVLKNYYLYVIFTPILAICSQCCAAYVSIKRFPQYTCRGKLNRNKKEKIVKSVVGASFQKFGNTISTSLDSIVTSAFLGLQAVAIYGNYYYVITAVLATLLGCINAAAAGIGNSISRESIEKNYSVFKKMNMLNQWCISWCVPCMLCLYQHFMRIWVGEELTAEVSFMLWMVLYFYVTQLRKIVLVFHDAAGMWWLDKWKPVVGCAINFALNIVLVQVIGIAGVIISTIISFLLVEIPWETHILFKHYFKSSEMAYYLSILKYGVGILAGTLLAWWLCALLPEYGILVMLLKGIIAFLTGNAIFILCWKNTSEFAELKTMLVKMVLRK